jgi:hypothetical protein
MRASCWECQKSTQHAAAVEWQAAEGLAPLYSDSPRQQAYAESTRYRVITDWRANVASQPPANIEALQVVTLIDMALEEITDPSRWAGFGRMTFDEVVRAVMPWPFWTVASADEPTPDVDDAEPIEKLPMPCQTGCGRYAMPGSLRCDYHQTPRVTPQVPPAPRDDALTPSETLSADIMAPSTQAGNTHNGIGAVCQHRGCGYQRIPDSVTCQPCADGTRVECETCRSNRAAGRVSGRGTMPKPGSLMARLAEPVTDAPRPCQACPHPYHVKPGCCDCPGAEYYDSHLPGGSREPLSLAQVAAFAAQAEPQFERIIATVRNS